MERTISCENDNRNEKNGMQTGNTDKKHRHGHFAEHAAGQELRHRLQVVAARRAPSRRAATRRTHQSGSQYGSRRTAAHDDRQRLGRLVDAARHAAEPERPLRLAERHGPQRHPQPARFAVRPREQRLGRRAARTWPATTATSSSITRRTSKRIPHVQNTNGSSRKELSFCRAAPGTSSGDPAAKLPRSGTAQRQQRQRATSFGRPPAASTPEASRRQRSATTLLPQQVVHAQEQYGRGPAPDRERRIAVFAAQHRYTAPAKSPAPMASEERAERSVPLRFAAAVALREVCFVMAESFSNAENGARTAPHALRRPRSVSRRDQGWRCPQSVRRRFRRRQPRSAPETPPNGDRG